MEPIEPYLAGLPLGAWRWLQSAGSTNDIAREWAAEGAPDLALVAADEQTAGRGRMQRRWVTNPGTALAFSLVLRPNPKDVSRLAHFVALGGLAAYQAFAEDYGAAAQIKWPNDVLLGRRKAVGILVESTWQGNDLQAVVIGMGVNVLKGSVPPPEDVLFPATSLEDALGRPVDRFEVLRSILRRMVEWRTNMGTPAFLQAWQDHLAFRGEMVTVTGTGEPARTGTLLGIDPQGNLRISNENGVELSIEFGDVHLRAA
jgi:BirA family biotin operon repressor/biotin-[acetyl-CoA-carboxylase] ligase